MANNRFIIFCSLIIISFLNFSLWYNYMFNVPRSFSDDFYNKSFKLNFNHQLFLIEPFILSKTLTFKQLKDLQWRFDLPEFEFNNQSLTFGIMEEYVENQMNTFQNYTKSDLIIVEGLTPFSNQTKLLHIFFSIQDYNIHIVIFHRIHNFFWIGKINNEILSKLKAYKIYFGLNEELYDLFNVEIAGSISLPDDVEHFLSQKPTSKYIHCPENRRYWSIEHNIPENQERIDITIETITSLKSLMRELKMVFWIMCGTLLGWFRQCNPIPYTTDSDFSTWPKYLKGKDISDILLKTAPKHNLKLFYRFGEPKSSMEYSFKTMKHGEKIDLFFTYQNESHFMIPSHISWEHTYINFLYPKYKLCSVELLGYKLLAPCEAEEVILAEYGPTWNEAIQNWNYSKSPLNAGPKLKFPPNISQFRQY